MSSQDHTIPAEARGVVRVLKHQLRRREARWNLAFESVEMTRAAERYNRAGLMGRQRALRTMCRTFGQLSCVVGDRPVWIHIRARDGVIVSPRDPGQAQDAVVVDYLTIDLGDFLHTGLWTLEVPDHALHRLAQRARSASLVDAITEAHRGLVRAILDPLPEPDQDVLVAAGPGAFIGQMVYGRDTMDANLVYFRARTWVHQDQMGASQVPLSVGSALQPLTIPVPLRVLEVTGDVLSVRLLGRGDRAAISPVSRPRSFCGASQNSILQYTAKLGYTVEN